MSNAALRALISQFTGLLLVFLLGRNGVFPALSLFALACVQAVLAASTSLLLRSPRWWVSVHLGFMPAVALALAAQLPAWLYGAGFVALVGLYWTTFRTQVPLFLSNRVTVHRLAQWLPDDKPLAVLDVGSGTGSFVHVLALLRPDWSIRGIESAPIPFLLSRLRTRHNSNAEVLRGDFWRHSLAEYDVVYAFLSPVPMPDIWRKVRRELRPGAWLVSNSFPVPGVEPSARVTIDDARGTTLFCYRAPGGITEVRDRPR